MHPPPPSPDAPPRHFVAAHSALLRSRQLFGPTGTYHQHPACLMASQSPPPPRGALGWGVEVPPSLWPNMCIFLTSRPVLHKLLPLSDPQGTSVPRTVACGSVVCIVAMMPSSSPLWLHSFICLHRPDQQAAFILSALISINLFASAVQSSVFASVLYGPSGKEHCLSSSDEAVLIMIATQAFTYCLHLCGNRMLCFLSRRYSALVVIKCLSIAKLMAEYLVRDCIFQSISHHWSW